MKETHETNLKFSKGKKKEASVALVYPPPSTPWDVSFRGSQQAISAQPNDDVKRKKKNLTSD